MENKIEEVEEVKIDDGSFTAKQEAVFAEEAEQMAAAAAMEAEVATGTSTGAAEVIGSVLTPEQFEQHFFELFDIVGDLWDMPDFKINHDKPFEIAGAKVSAAKLYLMANKYKTLHFLIEPCGGWFGDTIAIACFAGAKANIACQRFAKRSLLDYAKHFMKKSGEQVKNNGFFSRFFGSKEDDKQK